MKLFNAVKVHRAVLRRDPVRLAGDRLSCHHFRVDRDSDLRRLAESLRGPEKDSDRRAGAEIERLRPADDVY